MPNVNHSSHNNKMLQSNPAINNVALSILESKISPTLSKNNEFQVRILNPKFQTTHSMESTSMTMSTTTL